MAQRLLGKRPALKVLYMSGYADDERVWSDAQFAALPIEECQRLVWSLDFELVSDFDLRASDLRQLLKSVLAHTFCPRRRVGARENLLCDPRAKAGIFPKSVDFLAVKI